MIRDVEIRSLAQHVGETVRLKGWVQRKTGKGRLHFIRLRDGSGVAQCVAFRDELDPESFQLIRDLTQESAVIVEGVVRQDERAPGVPGGYEIGITSFQLIQRVEDFPITPKAHGTEFLMDHRHLWLRSSRQWAILRIRARIIRAMRDWLDEAGYLHVDTPILTAAAGEETTTLFEIDYFGERSYLAQTGQLYNEANIAAFGKVYCYGPTFRAEKSKTRRHLLEFWMLEPEMAFYSLEDMMDMEEQFVSYTIQSVLQDCQPELQILERDTTALERIAPPFPRISYDDAVARLQELVQQSADDEERAALAIEWGQDFGSPHETALAAMFEKPVFIFHYPTAVKAFYMQPVGGRPEICRSVDLLAPEGYGEITGGSERIHDAALMEQRVAEIGIERRSYDWYLELRKMGSVPHSGFGIGIERTVAWICGLSHIRETIPYPRLLNRNYP